MDRRPAHRILRWATEWHPTRSLRELHQSTELVRASGLLDAAWYKTQYADRVGAKSDAILHYLRHGVSLGCDPNPYFDARWYVERNPDAVAGMNPLLHYLTAGWKEGRDPSPLFSIAAYLRENPDVSATGREPLADYLARRRKNPATPAPNVPAPAEVAGTRPRICFTGHAGAETDFSKAPATLSVSVVVPNYNYARYLDQRLDSIKAQTHPIHEIIVLDATP